MDRRSQLLQRVRDAAAAIKGLFDAKGSNVPLEEYVDKTDIDALCDSLELDINEWDVADLSRIFVIRDGLYELRHRLRDKGDDGEYSVEQLLSALDRLYADLEHAFRVLDQESLRKAMAEVAALQRSAHVSVGMVTQTASAMQREAGEVLVQAHTSLKSIEVNFLKIDRPSADVEVLKSIKLSVQRLSASVFAIKLSLEQDIIYQGIFKLLSEGADRIVEELKVLVTKMQRTYNKPGDFISELTQLTEKSTRFTKLVGDFLHKAFLDADRTEEIVTRLKIQGTHNSNLIVAASVHPKGSVVLAGVHREAWTIDPSSGRVAPRLRLSDEPVYSIAHLGGDYIAVGLENALQVVGIGDESEEYISSARGRIQSIAAAHWGAKDAPPNIITGSREGFVTRWTLAGGLSQFNEDSYEQIGRRLHALIVNGREVIAASGVELIFLDSDMRTRGSVRVPFEVNGMDVVDPKTLIICGEGRITIVGLERGSFSRIITASNVADYTCVVANDSTTFFFGTKQGRVGIMDINSGEELASVMAGFEVRGIVRTGTKLVAYGGEWKKKGRSAALITLERERQLIARARAV